LTKARQDRNYYDGVSLLLRDKLSTSTFLQPLLCVPCKDWRSFHDAVLLAKDPKQGRRYCRSSPCSLPFSFLHILLLLRVFSLLSLRWFTGAVEKVLFRVAVFLAARQRHRIWVDVFPIVWQASHFVSLTRLEEGK
jgi:hypothetical protein